MNRLESINSLVTPHLLFFMSHGRDTGRIPTIRSALESLQSVCFINLVVVRGLAMYLDALICYIHNLLISTVLLLEYYRCTAVGLWDLVRPCTTMYDHVRPCIYTPITMLTCSHEDVQPHNGL